MQGWTSENVAAQENISRETIDEYALRSHNRAKDAQEKGLFKAEIVRDLPLNKLVQRGNAADSY
jgi:acetyl-CoA acetyltransferase